MSLRRDTVVATLREVQLEVFEPIGWTERRDSSSIVRKLWRNAAPDEVLEQSGESDVHN